MRYLSYADSYFQYFDNNETYLEFLKSPPLIGLEAKI